MRKIITFLLCIATIASVISLSGCSLLLSKEEQGVPRKQVEIEISNSTVDEYTIMNCSHDVDTTLHQDTVTVHYRTQDKYMRSDYEVSFVYQYNKDTDIWTKISDGKRNITRTVLDNLKGTTWTGSEKVGFGLNLTYKVTVDAVNTANGWIEFTYYIYFADKEYRGSDTIPYGSGSKRVENMFDVNFYPNTGMSVYRI